MYYYCRIFSLIVCTTEPLVIYNIEVRNVIIHVGVMRSEILVVCVIEGVWSVCIYVGCHQRKGRSQQSVLGALLPQLRVQPQRYAVSDDDIDYLGSCRDHFL